MSNSINTHDIEREGEEKKRQKAHYLTIHIIPASQLVVASSRCLFVNFRLKHPRNNTCDQGCIHRVLNGTPGSKELF